jgi:hypothetical protein
MSDISQHDQSSNIPSIQASVEAEIQDQIGEQDIQDLPRPTSLTLEETRRVLYGDGRMSPSRSSSPLLSIAGFPQKPKTDPIDLRSLEHIGSFDHNLMCAICHCPFVLPVKLDCDHYFCHSCVYQAMAHQPPDTRCCPTCRRKTSRTSIPVPKIINHILDELKVKCPFYSLGCTEELTRGSVQNHVDRYCAYSEVECPSEDCLLTIERKDLGANRCFHHVVRCQDCRYSFLERDIEYHRTTQCTQRKVQCPDCEMEVPRIKLEKHIDHCPEAIFPCTAASYGCDFISKRTILDRHLPTCALAKLVPFLKIQNERLEAHEAALKHLQHKNSILETSFASIQDTLGPSGSLVNAPSVSGDGSDTAPFDSTAHHLLCLHESLRDEVGRVSTVVSDLDAKASMMVINESLRIKEDLTHTNAAIGGMRMQLHWLMSARVQNQQRVAMGRTPSSGEATMAGPSTGASGPGILPVRRLSDSTRQETKL